MQLDWSQVPELIYDGQPQWLELYRFAWECAWDHRREQEGMPVSPYMDEAFCDTEFWIWDSCFMSLYCKYCRKLFPGVETLGNFYQVLYNGKSLPWIITHNPPGWTPWRDGQPALQRIHIADNPPLFAWAEYENALMHGDKERVRTLLKEGWLQKHFKAVLNYHRGEQPLNVSSPVRMEWDEANHGFYWEGGRSGMDNTPRGRTETPSKADRPSRPTLLWLDALAQQALSARCIADLAEIAEMPELVSEYRAEQTHFNDLLNKYYWDEEDGCYYDRDAADGSLCRILTIASFWPVLSGAADQAKTERMLRFLKDEKYLGGKFPLNSLSRSDADYSATGGYWRGGIWMPTAYMTVQALNRMGFYELTSELSEKIVELMSRTYHDFEPHTIWECYSPSENKPSYGCRDTTLVRKNFCGWSALGPISMMIENVIGIRSANGFTREVNWVLPSNAAGRFGIKGLCFGDITADFIFDHGKVRVNTNAAFTLKLNGTEYKLAAGEKEIILK